MEDQLNGHYDEAKAKGIPRSKPPTIILGDSIVKGLIDWKLSTSLGSTVMVISHSGARTHDMYSLCIPSLKEQNVHFNVVIHAGTNDLKKPHAHAGVAEKLFHLANYIEQNFPLATVHISELTVRADRAYLKTSVREVNKNLETLARDFGRNIIKHRNIDISCLNGSLLHLNAKGVLLLAGNMTRALNC